MSAADEESSNEDVAEPRPPGRRRVLQHPITQVFLSLLALSLIQGLAVKLYAVPSASMAPTLETGDRMLVNRLAYVFDEPRAGDVVVFNADDEWRGRSVDDPTWKRLVKRVSELISIGPGEGRGMVKRIAAGPGQSIECCSPDGHLIVDGVEVMEPYLGDNPEFVPGHVDCSTTPASMRCFPEYVVPAGEYLMLGDNRASSSDSVSSCRGHTDGDLLGCLRTVQHDDVVGKVLVAVWPLKSVGAVR